MVNHDDCLGGLREFFVFEAAGLDELYQSVTEEKAVVAVVEAECHFIEVSRQMLRTDQLLICSITQLLNYSFTNLNDSHPR